MAAAFSGKSALVTGGGRGIGRAIALALAERGCAVTLFARTESELAATAASIRERGGQADYEVGDIADPAALEHAADLAAGRGALDVLINAAGGFVTSPSICGDLDAWNEMLSKNLVGPYAACVAAARRMRDTGGGRIVNFGSLLSFTAFPERAAYAASKAGVVQMTRVLGVEWARSGVIVNCIVPGMIAIETPHPLVVSGEVSDDAFLKRIPAGRRGAPADLVGPALFLASDEARYVVGQTLVVDGGWLSYGYI
jgi:2-deoxy-D-gluconate 3-dehydrogenase